jgi:hypothetical protein
LKNGFNIFWALSSIPLEKSDNKIWALWGLYLVE